MKSNKTIKKRLAKPVTQMNAAELDDLTRQFEGIRFEDTQPLSEREQKQWAQGRRRPGRPRRGQGALRVLMSIERGLLERTDAFARTKAIGRSELIATALAAFMDSAQSGAGKPSANHARNGARRLEVQLSPAAARKHAPVVTVSMFKDKKGHWKLAIEPDAA